MPNEKAKDLKEYEILYFLPITLSPDETQAIKQKVNGIITKHTGVIIKEEEIGKKKLAYMIKHARHGYYIFIVFKSPPSVINDINHEIKLMPEILRHKLILKESIKNIETEKKVRDIDKPSATELEKKQKQKKKKEIREETSVDVKELDKKIDELLAEDKI